MLKESESPGQGWNNSISSEGDEGVSDPRSSQADSSPDLDAEPTLPKIPSSHNVFTGPKSVFRSRKRAYVEDAAPLFSTSSDPAVFSSDDDPALENLGRRKKRYIGSWFQQVPASSDSALGDEESPCSAIIPKRKRTLRRQFDSGVYVDGLLDSSDIESDVGPVKQLDNRLRTASLGVPAIQSNSDASIRKESNWEHDLIGDKCFDSRHETNSPTKSYLLQGARRAHTPDVSYSHSFLPAKRNGAPTVATRDSAVQDYLLMLVENGDDTVDLSNWGLDYLSNATVGVLSGLVRIPTVVEDVEFEQPDTRINLILSNNFLIRAPGAIFELENLTTLSLRGNQLLELPSSISKCKNLRHLNVSRNRLRYLPGELLDLVNEEGGLLKEIYVSGNPFYQAKRDLIDNQHGELEQQNATCRLVRTPIQYMDTTGNVYSDFKLDDRPEVELEPEWELSPPRQTLRSALSFCSSALPSEGCRVPSLLELALQSVCRASRNDVSLVSHLTDFADYMPNHIRGLLDEAAMSRYQGGPASCNICGRPFVRARTKWLEFLSPVTVSLPSTRQNSALAQIRIDGAPFLRRGCSWKCVPIVRARTSSRHDKSV